MSKEIDDLAIEIYQRGGVTLREAFKLAWPKPGPKPGTKIERNAAIVAEYLNSPVSAKTIADKYGITGARVLSILRAHGVTRKDGARAKVIATRVRPLMRNAASHGLTNDQYTRARDEGLTPKFTRFVANCGKRNIDLCITALQYYEMWWSLDVPLTERRKYCISRIDPNGPYSPENTHIELRSSFFSRTMKRTMNQETHKNSGGVFLFHPNTKKPWIARASNRIIGYFATREEAVAARQRALLPLDGQWIVLKYTPC